VRRGAARLTLFLSAAALGAACSVPPEQPIVGDFFAASRLRDTTALAKFATVVFEPREQGIVASFEIERVSPQRTVGDMLLKEVLVRAVVRDGEGRSGERRLTVTLQKRRGANDVHALYGGWLVTAVTDAEGSRAAPRS
jgi:hypothetical protein